MKYIFFLIVVLFSCCKMPSNKKGINYIVLDFNQLKNNILNDTSHFKILIFYNSSCGCCNKHFNVYYNKAINEFDENVKFYFIPESEVNLFFYDKLYLKEKNIDCGTIYYIQDTNIFFDIKNNRRTANIINSIFKTNRYIESLGLPTSIIVNKSNIIKIKKCHFYNDSIIRYIPFQIHNLENYEITNLNFNKIEDAILEINYEYFN